MIRRNGEQDFLESNIASVYSFSLVENTLAYHQILHWPKILGSFFFVMNHLFSFLVKQCGVIEDSACDVCKLGKNKMFFYPPNLNESRSFKTVLSDVRGPTFLASLFLLLPLVVTLEARCNIYYTLSTKSFMFQNF